jgi:hypothetical protein
VQVLDDVVHGVVVVVHNVHDRDRTDVARLENRLALAVDDGVVAVDFGVDKLLHDVGNFQLFDDEEVAEVIVAGQLVGVGRAHAVIRLDNDGVADFADERFAAVEIIHHMVARRRDAGLLIVFLHLGLELDARHIADLEAAGDVEIGTEHGVALQPVFVVALQPVDTAVFADKERNSAVHLVVILHAADLVVFVQGALEFGQKGIIGLIADTENAQSVIAQLTAELPVVDGEIGGNENEILHGLFHPFVFTEPKVHWINTRALPESVTNSIAKWVSRGSKTLRGCRANETGRSPPAGVQRQSLWRLPTYRICGT